MVYIYISLPLLAETPHALGVLSNGLSCFFPGWREEHTYQQPPVELLFCSLRTDVSLGRLYDVPVEKDPIYMHVCMHTRIAWMERWRLQTLSYRCLAIRLLPPTAVWDSHDMSTRLPWPSREEDPDGKANHCS